MTRSSKPLRWPGRALAAAAPLLLLASAASAADAGPSGATHDAAAVIPNSATGRYLMGDLALSPDNVWTVGYSMVDGTEVVIARHWTGKKWKRVKVPLPQGATWTQLNALAATSPKNIWAVGYSSDSATQVTWAEHYNGKKWKVVPTPNPTGLGVDGLSDVTATAPDDVWATGLYLAATGAAMTLIEHWDGKKWSIVDSPNQGASWNPLRSTAAISAKDAWTVGEYSNDSQSMTAVADHWNGKKWSPSTVALPNGVTSSLLMGVSAVSSDDVWAAGCTSQIGAIFCDRVADGQDALLEHWDGSSWSIVTAPAPDGATAFELTAVSAISTDDVWITGSYSTDGTTTLPYSAHWDGSSWTAYTVPLHHQSGLSPLDVSGSSANNVWLVGVGSPKPLAARSWDGKHWKTVNP